jgi:hypothetical protein
MCGTRRQPERTQGTRESLSVRGEADVLVDRIDELARVVRVAEECGTLFLIGPRRFGKTSILRAAEAKLTDAGKVVLRYDAEAFDDIGSLAAALLAGAVRKYSSALDRGAGHRQEVLRGVEAEPYSRSVRRQDHRGRRR